MTARLASRALYALLGGPEQDMFIIALASSVLASLTGFVLSTYSPIRLSN
jgi:hypothetical protein